MKRFFNFFTVVMLIIFLGGLVVTAVLGNWLAFVWIIIGAIQMLIAREHEMVRDRLADDYEAQLLEAQHLRLELEEKYEAVSDKYQAKLKENYDLACHNKSLAEANVRLAQENQELGGKGQPLGAATVVEKRGVHGNIKLKRKKQTVQETDTDIQDNA
jgi:hypothetical protein